MPSLVGSEMCIRDRPRWILAATRRRGGAIPPPRTTIIGADDRCLGRRGMRPWTHAARLRPRVRLCARARLAAPNLSLAVRGGLEREPRASRDLQRNGSRRRRQNRHDVDRTGSRSLACVVRGGGIAPPRRRVAARIHRGSRLRVTSNATSSPFPRYGRARRFVEGPSRTEEEENLDTVFLVEVFWSSTSSIFFFSHA